MVDLDERLRFEGLAEAGREKGGRARGRRRMGVLKGEHKGERRPWSLIIV